MAYGTGTYGVGTYGVGGGVAGPVWLFRTPTRPNPRYTKDSTRAQIALYRHFTTAPVGVAVLNIDGAWVERNVVTSRELEAANRAYLGGRDYLLGAAEGQLLEDAGYGAYLIPLSTPNIPAGYGTGAYGTGIYGS